MSYAMAMIQRNADGTWNVECYVCHKKLGSNKLKCGKEGKIVKLPPCVWAETDSQIVAKCHRLFLAKMAQHAEGEQKYAADQRKYFAEQKAGTKRIWTWDADEDTPFPLLTHVYAADVAFTGRIKKHLTNSKGDLVTGYVVNYDGAVFEGDDEYGEHSMEHVYMIIDNDSAWPAQALPRRSFVNGVSGIRGGVRGTSNGYGAVCHCAVNVRGEVAYYGVLLLNCGQPTHFTVENVTLADPPADAATPIKKKSDAAATVATPKTAYPSTATTGNVPKGGQDTVAADASGANAAAVASDAAAKVATPKKQTSDAAHTPPAKRAHVAAGGQDNAAADASDANAGESTATGGEETDSSRMNWTHESKVCLYGWVLKLNPFAAKRGTTKDVWNEVAKQCAHSTRLVSKQGGRIDVSGHGLEVYVGLQLKALKKKADRESKTSGQTGQLSDLERVEYNLLQEIVDKKQHIVEGKEAEKEAKQLHDNIKADQLGDAIYEKCLKTPQMMTTYLKQLCKRRKAAKQKLDVIIESNARLSQEQQLQLLSDQDRDILIQYAKVKKDSRMDGRLPTTDDGDDDEPDRGAQKKASVVHSIANIANMSGALLDALQKPTALETTMMNFYAAKMADRDIETRLRKLDEALEKHVITEKEWSKLRSRILRESF
jgi:hypothetical protein